MAENNIKKYFIRKEIKKLKENIKNIDLKTVREEFLYEARKIVNEVNQYLDASLSNENLNIENINNNIKIFNDRLNEVNKKGNVSSLVYIMPDMSEDEFYEPKIFIENISITDNDYFNKFADNKNINYELLDRIILLDEKIKEIEESDTNNKNIKNLYKERAEIYNKLSMYSYAIEDLSKAIEIDSNDIDLHILKLDILKKDDKLNSDDIIKCYDDIINLDKNNLENYYKKLEYLQSLKNREEDVIKCYDDIINIDKNNLEGYYKKIEYLESLGNRQNNIIKCFDDIIELDKNDFNRYYKKLWYLQSLKNREEDIIKLYDDIINIDKNNLESHYKKLEYLQSLNGRQKEIINCCNEILNVDSNNIKALYIIAEEYRKQADKTSNEDDYKKALEYYNKVKSIDENFNNVQYYEEYCLEKINYNDNLQKEIKYYYDKAEAFFELGKYQEALNCADKAVSLDEKFYKSYYFKGCLLKNIENYNEAIECFDKAIEINDKDTDSYYNKALILFEFGRYEEKEFNNITKLGETSYNTHYKGLTLYRERKYAEAVNEFDEAIKLNNANNYNNEAYYYKGLSLFELKKYDEALESFKSTNNFNRYDIYYFLGEIYETKNNYKEAFKYYEEALKNYKEKNNSRDYYIIGMTLYKLSEFDKAIDNFNKALSFIFEDNKNLEDILNYCNNILKLEKNNKVFYAYKIIALILLNRYDEALSLYNNIEKNNESLGRDELYQKALNILDENKIDVNSNKKEAKEEDNKSDIESLKEQINLLKSKGENYLVMEWYDKIIEANNQNIESYREKIAFAKSIGNSKEAIKCYDKMMKLSPIEAYKGKAEIYRTLANENDSNKEKYYDLAIECYDNVIELNLSDTEAYKGKAEIYEILYKFKNNNSYYKLYPIYYQKAIKCYNKAIELNPNDIEAYKGKADVCCNIYIGKYDLAIECYDKVIELNPNYTEAYKGKADTYYIKKDYNLAIECYDKVIELNPNYTEAYKGKADTYYIKKDYNLAIEWYDKAIKLNPNYAEAYKGKADTYYQLANYDDDDYDYYDKRKKYYNLAIEWYDKSIELNHNYAEAYKGKADTYYKINNYNLAIKWYDKAIELKPSSELYRCKSEVLSSLKRYSEAEECRRKAEELRELGL